MRGEKTTKERENKNTTKSALEFIEEISSLKNEMATMKRQLRQRKALFNIFLSKMGGISFEFEIATDTAYFTEMDEKGVPKETEINNFRRWIYSHAKNGTEILLRLQKFLETKGESGEEKDYGTIEATKLLQTNYNIM